MPKKISKVSKKLAKNEHIFEPTKMALAVSAAAASTLALFATLAFYS